ncbi:hypothetical protein N658DRAFT_361163, partial [Parathielavia hyrcaniae]
MRVDELDLCPCCVDLLEKGPVAGDSTTVAHHSTYGALITSSENCALCVCLCSLLSGPSLLLSEGETCKKWPFQVELAEHSGQFSPDVSWGEYIIGVTPRAGGNKNGNPDACTHKTHCENAWRAHLKGSGDIHKGGQERPVIRGDGLAHTNPTRWDTARACTQLPSDTDALSESSDRGLQGHSSPQSGKR